MSGNYKSKIELIKQNYEDLISKNSATHTQELMKLSNENILKRQTINKLNKQIEEQQNLLDNLNKKLIFYQDNNREKEVNMNQKIKIYKNQCTNFQNIIEDLNRKLEKLKNEYEVYKNKNNKLLSIEKEYEILKNENDNLNNNYIILRKEYVKMKVDFENNKKECEKAIKEMNTYSQLLIALENKMNNAEKDKIKAELERDRAVQETREIRQRYINIMSNNT